jgi:hypothetical protein
MEQLSAPESLTPASGDGVLEGRELPPLVAASWRKKFVRFSKTFFRPRHKSSQSPYFFAGSATEFSVAASVRKFFVAAGAEAAAMGLAAADVARAGSVVVGVATTGIGAAEVAAVFVDADCDSRVDCVTGVGVEPERGCGGAGFADAESSKDCDGGLGFRARFSDEFSQKEILALPSGCRMVCRCKGHWPR